MHRLQETEGNEIDKCQKYATFYEKLDFTANISKNIVLGTIFSTKNQINIDYRSLVQQNKIAKSTIRSKPTVISKVASWKSTGDKVTSSPSGRIFAVASKPPGKIQAFDTQGNIWMEINTTGWVLGLTCHHNNGKDTLALAMRDRIELRDGLNGDLLDTLTSDEFIPNGPMCQSCPCSILVSVKSHNQRHSNCILVQCVINEGKIKEGKRMSIPLKYVDGLTVTRNGMKIVMVTSELEQTILAIDYEREDVIWKNVRTRLDGRSLVPGSICMGGGNKLFVVDSYMNGVLVLDMTDQREIETQNENGLENITCIPNQNKMIVTDRNHKISVYDIKYNN